MSTGSNSKKTSSHNKRKRIAAKRGVATSIFGLGANISKFISTGTSGFGDMNNDDQSRTVDAFNSIASILGVVSAGTGLVGHFMDCSRRQDVIDAAAIHSVNDDDDTQEDRKRSSRHLMRWGSNPAQQLSSKKNYNTFKAKKYALNQATEFN